MSSIMDLAKTEAMLFKYGSGAGVNLSTIRGSKEKMSGGGIASGPVSFMKGFDAFAGVVKSGGKTRRAAKMVILDAGHPDILDFVESKASEERKAWALIEAGYDPSFTGEAYGSVFFQNANHSVRVTDDFMRAVEQDAEWTTHEVTTGDPAGSYPARLIFRRMAEAAWICGDPGIQYDTTINDWNPVANSDRQYATNPCSEFSFLNDTSCNLASLNLMKFVDAAGEFDVEAFRFAARLTITAQEILVDNASYPTPQIEENSHRYRPLGLGYANLGALLMSRGLAYDSDEGRAFAGAITAIMTGEAYRQSAVVARDHGGPFNDYAINEGPFLRVIRKHREAAYAIDERVTPRPLVEAARLVWDEALQLGEQHGYRNAQVTVLAPTGTIAFMMDCDTTGIEPDIALIKYKKLVGEGFLKIVNGTVPAALRRLGYTPDEVEAIVAHIDEHETIEGAPALRPEHLSVFDCAFKPVNGERSIHHMGHLRMMSATQPFLSGAISKTVNMPESATAEDIEDVYLQGWKLGLKAIAIYRDGSKRSQPLSTGKKKAAEAEATTPTAGEAPGLELTGEPKPYRRRLPDERRAVTHKFQVAGHEGYITVGLYPDGTPGEIFLKMAKEGSTVSGLMDTLATMTSIALQYGVPLRDLVSKFTHVRFEPSGFTGNPEVPIAKSTVDYIFRWMGSRFLSKEDRDALGILGGVVVAEAPEDAAPRADLPDFVAAGDDRTTAAFPPAPSTSSGEEGGGRPAAFLRSSGSTTIRDGSRGPGDPRRRQCPRERQRHRLPRSRSARGLLGQRRLAVVHGLRQHHGAQRELLQVPQLRRHERLQLTRTGPVHRHGRRWTTAGAVERGRWSRPSRRSRTDHGLTGYAGDHAHRDLERQLPERPPGCCRAVARARRPGHPAHAGDEAGRRRGPGDALPHGGLRAAPPRTGPLERRGHRQPGRPRRAHRAELRRPGGDRRRAPGRGLGRGRLRPLRGSAHGQRRGRRHPRGQSLRAQRSPGRLDLVRGQAALVRSPGSAGWRSRPRRARPSSWAGTSTSRRATTMSGMPPGRTAARTSPPLNGQPSPDCVTGASWTSIACHSRTRTDSAGTTTEPACSTATRACASTSSTAADRWRTESSGQRSTARRARARPRRPTTARSSSTWTNRAGRSTPAGMPPWPVSGSAPGPAEGSSLAPIRLAMCRAEHCHRLAHILSR